MHCRDVPHCHPVDSWGSAANESVTARLPTMLTVTATAGLVAVPSRRPLTVTAAGWTRRA